MGQKTEHIAVRQPLTVEELAAYSQELAALVKRAEDLEIEKKEVSRDFKEKLDEIAKEISYRSEIVRRGYRMEVQEQIPLEVPQ